MNRIECNLETGEILTIELTQEELAAIEAKKPTLEQRNAAIKAQRAERMSKEADPMFFQVEAGEINRDEWLAVRQKIRDELPYEVE